MSSTTVGNVMETAVFACEDCDRVKDAIDLMVLHGVGGIPIVDANGFVVGYISDGDIMRGMKNSTHFIGDVEYGDLFVDGRGFADKVSDVAKKNVMKIATKKVRTLRADDSLDYAVEYLGRKSIHKAPVVSEDGRLIGVVSRGIIMRYCMKLGEDLRERTEACGLDAQTHGKI